jgi:hypothetical protein
LKALTFGSYGYFLSVVQKTWKINSTNSLTSGNGVPLFCNFFAGMGAGIVNSVASCPVERAKIVLQTQRNEVATVGTTASINSRFAKNYYFQFGNFSLAPTTPKFTGPIDVVKKLGLVGMYKGFLPTGCPFIIFL